MGGGLLVSNGPSLGDFLDPPLVCPTKMQRGMPQQIPALGEHSMQVPDRDWWLAETPLVHGSRCPIIPAENGPG